jgi:SAM-dependent methyltransferase
VPKTSRAPSAKAIRNRFPGNPYVGFHSHRFNSALAASSALSPKPSRVLDIGVSDLTTLLREQLAVPVDTLGFLPDADNDTGGRNYYFDLNDSIDQTKWRRDLPPYDLIVFCEVVEHLYTSPSHVLPFLRSLLAPGGTLVLQTPNAAALGKRVRLLLGRNPYDHIHPDRTAPRHFREYTQGELVDYVVDAGFEVVKTHMTAYFDFRFPSDAELNEKPPAFGHVKNVVYRVLPGSLRAGIMVLARRPAVA